MWNGSQQLIIMNESIKRIVLLYADTGGGHRATAQAIAAALHELRGEGQACLVAGA